MARAIDIDGVMDRIRNLPREWKVASTCTGTGTFETALNAVACAVSTHLPVEDPEVTDPCQTFMLCPIECTDYWTGLIYSDLLDIFLWLIMDL